MAHLQRVYRRSKRISKAAILHAIEPCARGRLLDCGCGDGEFTVRVACRARVSEAYGIERVDERIREAMDRGVIVTKGDLNDPLPYKSRFFDIVHASQIIGSLANAELFLGEIRRVLRPDGYAILAVNNVARWHSRSSVVPGFPWELLGAGSGATVGEAFDLLEATCHPAESESLLLILSFQGLAELCRHHGFWLERMTFAGYYPLMSHLIRRTDKLPSVHAASLIAKLRPIS
ncbi:MAG: class I SAM-dependent methyltransferase [Dehalococcoidia bacterium]